MFSRKPSRSFSVFVLFNVTPDPVDHPPLLAMLDIETWVRTHTAFSSLRCGNGGSMIFGFNLLQWIMDRLTEIFNALNGPLAPLFNMISSTSLTFTTQNAVVIAGWRTMTSVADVLLGLFIVIGTIQIMYGDTTNSLRMPIGQFVGKAHVDSHPHSSFSISWRTASHPE